MKSTNTEKISSVTLKGTWFDIFSNCEVSVKIHLKVIFQVNPQLAFLFQRLKNSNLSKTTTNKYVILSNIEKWKNFGVILTMNYSVTISRIIRHVPEVVRSPKVFSVDSKIRWTWILMICSIRNNPISDQSGDVEVFINHDTRKLKYQIFVTVNSN